MKAVVFWLIIFAGIIMGSFQLANSVRADQMRSDSYEIQYGNFNMTSGTQTDSVNYTLTNTLGQIAPGPYGEYGVSSYFLGSGFQYIYQIYNFSFRISKLAIALGTLSPGVHSTDSHTLTITTRGGSGYKVYAYETKPLTIQDGTEVIANTSCDAGTCTFTTAGTWTNQSIAGFGYNMSGHDVPTDFTNTNYFRPFANQAGSQAMQEVMGSANIAKYWRQSTVTYKAGISGSQTAGRYQTNVVFVAVPGY